MLVSKVNKLGLFLTQNCNFRCIYCCIKTGEDPPDKLTIEELKDLIEQARGIGIKRIAVCGAGEPTLDKNLIPLIKISRDAGISCDLNTNLSLIDKNLADFLFRNNVRVYAKLNSLDKNIQDELAGKKNCHSWISLNLKGNNYEIPKGLYNLLTAGYCNSDFFSLRKRLIIETVVCQLNITQIPKLADFCYKLGVGIFIEKLLPPALNTDYNRLDVSPSNLNKLFNTIIPRIDFESKLNTLFRCPFEVNPFIDINGDMRFCFAVKKSVGNIRAYSLKELHKRQLSLKNKFSRKSAAVKLKFDGFRHCRTREAIKRENFESS